MPLLNLHLKEALHLLLCLLERQATGARLLEFERPSAAEAGREEPAPSGPAR